MPIPPTHGSSFSGNEFCVFQAERNRMFAVSLRASLTRQIEEKYEEVKEREHTSRKKKSWCQDIERIIKQSYPKSQLVLVGSSANSFATEGCDVDLTLIRPNTGLFYGSTSNVQVLRRIRDDLRSIPTINTEVCFHQLSCYCFALSQCLVRLNTPEVYLVELEREFLNFNSIDGLVR